MASIYNGPGGRGPNILHRMTITGPSNRLIDLQKTVDVLYSGLFSIQSIVCSDEPTD